MTSPARQVVTSTRRRHACVAAMRASVALTVTLGRAMLIHATMLAPEAVVTIRTVATSVNAGLRTRDSSVTHLKVSTFILIGLSFQFFSESHHSVDLKISLEDFDKRMIVSRYHCSGQSLC